MRDGSYVFGVFTTGRPPWSGRLWIPRDDGPQITQVVCGEPSCEHEWDAVGRPHSTCGEHRCPRCGKCGCGRGDGPAQVMCAICTMTVPVTRVTGGVCSDCQ
jgi:hypothetical protein